MKPSLFRFCLVGLCAISWGLLAPNEIRSEPSRPKDDQQVLERLRLVPFDPGVRELREWHKRLEVDPNNLLVATQFARRCIERSRAEADPRFLGRAQAVLAPWWNEPAPPVEAMVLRATIKQSQHDFTNALADLEIALRLSPGNGQAWLTRGTILTVLGRYDEARRACIPLVGRAPEMIALTAAASISGLNGGAEHSCELLQQALDRNPSAPASERLWALTVLAETSARLGQSTHAQECFQRALALGQRDAYLLAAYADFLIDQGGCRDTVNLLKEETRADNLLLRLALAESGLEPKPATLETHIATLRARFEASHLRGDAVHQREEARFSLHLLHQPLMALRLAEANWQIQHEPADVRILLETALAARDSAAAQPALDFLHRTRLQDKRLAQLSDQLASLSAEKPGRPRASSKLQTAHF